MARKPSTAKPQAARKSPRKRKDATRAPTDGESRAEDETQETQPAEDGDDLAEPVDQEIAGEHAAERPSVEIAAPTKEAITRFDPFAAYMREVQRHPLMTRRADARASR